MDISDEKKIPKVFVSYSHDSPSHKQWVAAISSKLIKNGIDVILDQWDLGLGDDVPKFMENSVTQADRVLMICTEPYVRKADEGYGGVGYEAMIVTGELIRDLGTSKFIPIIRQTVDPPSLPKSVCTRFYVNLSDGQNVDEQFDLLLRELHKERIINKPPLGKNPFAQQPSGVEIPLETATSINLPDLALLSDDTSTVYHTALKVAMKGDLVVWRRMVRLAVSPISEQLNNWRKKYENSFPNDIKSSHETIMEAANIYATIFGIALAGIESGRDKFTNQISLIDEILNPRDWNPSGLTSIVDLPDAIACIYQALNGAMCLQTHQLSLSTKLALTKITKRNQQYTLPLYQRHEIVGWPAAVGRKSTEVWSFLSNLPEKWNWLNEPFGSVSEYRESLCAYYLALNIIEFVDTIVAGKEDLLQQKEIRLDVPLCFLRDDFEIIRRAYHLLLVEPDQIRDIWKSKSISDNKVKELWPMWVHHIKYWLSRENIFSFPNQEVVHENLFNEIV
jgi:hypothetical protein